jgi:hypothetical protein
MKNSFRDKLTRLIHKYLIPSNGVRSWKGMCMHLSSNILKKQVYYIIQSIISTHQIFLVGLIWWYHFFEGNLFLHHTFQEPCGAYRAPSPFHLPLKRFNPKSAADISLSHRGINSLGRCKDTATSSCINIYPANTASVEHPRPTSQRRQGITIGAARCHAPPAPLLRGSSSPGPWLSRTHHHTSPQAPCSSLAVSRRAWTGSWTSHAAMAALVAKGRSAGVP